MKSPMSSKQIQPNAASNAVDLELPFVREELPLTVQQRQSISASVSRQCIFGCSESRFPTPRNGSKYPLPASGSRPFRATFKQEVGDGKT
jgi:hypothetical protein